MQNWLQEWNFCDWMTSHWGLQCFEYPFGPKPPGHVIRCHKYQLHNNNNKWCVMGTFQYLLCSMRYPGDRSVCHCRKVCCGQKCLVLSVASHSLLHFIDCVETNNHSPLWVWCRLNYRSMQVLGSFISLHCSLARGCQRWRCRQWQQHHAAQTWGCVKCWWRRWWMCAL